jgi:hypothetical protein
MVTATKASVDSMTLVPYFPYPVLGLPSSQEKEQIVSQVYSKTLELEKTAF